MKANEKILSALEIVYKKIQAGEKFSLDRVTRSMLLSGSVGTAIVDAGIVERYGHTQDVSYKWLAGPPSPEMAEEVKETMRVRREVLFPKPQTAQRETIDRLAVSMGHSVTIDPQIALNGPGFVTPTQRSMLSRALGMDNPPPENIFTSSRISEEKLYLIGQVAAGMYSNPIRAKQYPELNRIILTAADDLYNKIYSPLTSQNEQANHQGNG